MKEDDDFEADAEVVGNLKFLNEYENQNQDNGLKPKAMKDPRNGNNHFIMDNRNEFSDFEDDMELK